MARALRADDPYTLEFHLTPTLARAVIRYHSYDDGDATLRDDGVIGVTELPLTAEQIVEMRAWVLAQLQAAGKVA